MRHHKLTEEPRTTIELQEDEVNLPDASEQDFELAKQLGQVTQDSPGVYTDGEFYYYCVNVEVESLRRTLNNPKGTRKSNQDVWVRSTIVGSGYSRMEPEEFDEVVVDKEVGYFTLSDAVRKTLLERYERELMYKTNICNVCDGNGFWEEIDGDHKCNACKGAGWFKLAKKD